MYSSTICFQRLLQAEKGKFLSRISLLYSFIHQLIKRLFCVHHLSDLQSQPRKKLWTFLILARSGSSSGPQPPPPSTSETSGVDDASNEPNKRNRPLYSHAPPPPSFPRELCVRCENTSEALAWSGAAVAAAADSRLRVPGSAAAALDLGHHFPLFLQRVELR